MMQKFILLVIASFVISAGYAQTRLLTIEDALVNNKTTLAPSTLHKIQFLYNTSDYVYLNKETKTWKRGNFTQAGEKDFLTLAQLNHKLRTAGTDTFSTMPDIIFNESPQWIISHSGNKSKFDPVTGKLTTLVSSSMAGTQAYDLSKKGYLAYVDKHNLFINDGVNTTMVTIDGSANIVYGQTVHREEFGITKGLFWSNEGDKLAFYRMDQSMVSDYPVIDWNERPAKVINIKYPMAGDKSHEVKVGVYNMSNKSLLWLNTGVPADQYLTNIAWSPDDKSIYIAVVNREQNHMKLNQYSAETGEWVKTLFEEKDEKYVEPMVPMRFLKNNLSRFIWQSNRDGWNHLYEYDVDGNLLRQLTKGEWEVTDVKGFDAKGENLFYLSTEQSPLTRDLYSLNLRTGISRRITQGAEYHAAEVNSAGSMAIDMASSLSNAGVIRLVDTKNGKTKEIFRSKNPLADFKLGELSTFPIAGPGNETLYCRMYKPVNFDSSRKYPVIVYWYGGPHVQLISNSWNGGAKDYWFQYMAERGYIVFSLDTRGSDYRGKKFEQAIFRRLGDAQMEDMLAGVNWLKSKSWVDKENMGLYGWSFGGFMTTNFLLNHPGIFKSAVAGGPVIDWKLYEVMYTERYMDTPQENPNGYEATNLLKKVDRLKDRLLLVHGLQDPVVVQQHSVLFTKAAVDKKVQVDYMIYPGHEHNVLGKDRAHLFQKISNYFIETIKPAKLGF